MSDTLVCAAAPCALLAALAEALPDGGRIGAFSRGGTDGLRLRVEAAELGTNSLDSLDPSIIDELNRCRLAGAEIDAVRHGGSLRVEFSWPPPDTERPTPNLEYLSHGRLEALEPDVDPTDPKRVYRRGDEVVKVQLDASFDAKPTLLDDEFLRHAPARRGGALVSPGHGDGAPAWLPLDLVPV